MKPASVGSGKERLGGAWSIVFLVATLWLVRYARSGEFGLYEDDFTHIPTASQMTGPELGQFTLDTFRDFRGQGTPLKLTLWYGLAHLGWGLGGLRGLYSLGFLIIATNVTLFYLLARNMGGRAFGLCAGLAYVLYSADTTQAFLSHSFILQTSITMLLMALLGYRARWGPVAYALISLTLITYETTYLVFLAAPLLVGPWDGAWRGRWMRHIGLCLAILAGVVVLRVALGENRVGGLTLTDILLVPVTHVAVGPAVALGTYIYRPIQALASLRWDTILASLGGVAVFGVVLGRTRIAMPGTEAGDGGGLAPLGAVHATRRMAGRLAWIPAHVRPSIRLACVGLIMLALAYPLTFTVRPYAISGRDTRVHASGVVGASIVVGSIMMLAIGTAEARGRKAWAVGGVSLVAGLLVGYGFVLQSDYARAWRLQQAFWRHLVPQISDVREGSVVLVDPSGLEDTQQIGANYWNLPRVLSQMFQFPSAWEPQPRVYRLAEGWEKRILTEDEGVRLDGATTLAPPGTYTVVEADRVIFIGTSTGEPQRAEGRFPSDGFNLTPLPPDGEPAYPHGFLYALIMAEPFATAATAMWPADVKSRTSSGAAASEMP